MHINLRTQILNWNLFCIFVRYIAWGILSVCKVCSTHENKEIPTSLYHCLLFGRCICCWNVRYWLVVVQYVMYCHPLSYSNIAIFYYLHQQQHRFATNNTRPAKIIQEVFLPSSNYFIPTITIRLLLFLFIWYIRSIFEQKRIVFRIDGLVDMFCFDTMI